MTLHGKSNLIVTICTLIGGIISVPIGIYIGGSIGGFIAVRTGWWLHQRSQS